MDAVFGGCKVGLDVTWGGGLRRFFWFFFFRYVSLNRRKRELGVGGGGEGFDRRDSYIG